MENIFKVDTTFENALSMIANQDTKINVDDSSTKPKPFVKWVGGKRSLINQLKENLPNEFNNYYEPFIGGGALFWDKLPNNANISDVNVDLILTYKAIQLYPHKLIEKLEIHKSKHNEKYYYSIRSQHRMDDIVDVAARFIYLNKTCFNGLYRVNSKGEFNVPIGSYKNPKICHISNILSCHESLKDIGISLKDFHEIQPKKDDFVYFDPPYDPIKKDSFKKYNKSNFNDDSQIRLAQFCKELDRKGVKFMLSNSDTDFIKSLYKDFSIIIVQAPRSVNCKASGRGKVNEVLIRNYTNDTGSRGKSQ